MELQISKTVVFWNSTAVELLLENTTVRNSTSGYHPVSQLRQFCLQFDIKKIGRVAR